MGIPSSIVTFAVLVSLVEAQGLRIKEAQGDSWMPGDYGTLRIAERGTEQFNSLAEGEIWNARIAMIAILAYVARVCDWHSNLAYHPFLGLLNVYLSCGHVSSEMKFRYRMLVNEQCVGTVRDHVRRLVQRNDRGR